MTRTRKLVVLLVAVAGLAGIVASADTTRVPSLGATLASILSANNTWTGVQTFGDEAFKVCDDGDATKCYQDELSGVTTANTIIVRRTGTAAAPGFGLGATDLWSVTVGANTIYNIAANSQVFAVAGTNYAVVNASGVAVGSGDEHCWANGADPAAAACDTGSERLAAGVQAPTNGAGAAGWTQMQAARSMLAADYTNATTTFSNTALSITVTSGRKYTFQAELFVDNATDANGGKINFNGGTATATNFRADCFEVSTVLDNNTQVTALATTITAATITGSGRWSCAGSFEPSGSGTFIMQAASNGGATTFTMFRGSHIWVEDMP